MVEFGVVWWLVAGGWLLVAGHRTFSVVIYYAVLTSLTRHIPHTTHRTPPTAHPTCHVTTHPLPRYVLGLLWFVFLGFAVERAACESVDAFRKCCANLLIILLHVTRVCQATTAHLPGYVRVRWRWR